MWTAANFIIKGRMQSYGHRLCTVDLTFFMKTWTFLKIRHVIRIYQSHRIYQTNFLARLS